MKTRDAPSRTALVRSVAEDILKAFETGTLPKALAQVFIHRDVEIASQHWTWPNRLIGSLRGHVYAAGYRQWEALGRHVKRGEHAFHILAPRMKKCEAVEAAEGAVVSLRHVGYLAVPVFGYLQTEGEPLAGAEEEAALISQLPLIEVARAWGLEITTYSFDDCPGQLGFYAPGSGIGLGVENLSTWAHELIHAADHRLGSTREDKLAAEIVAELGSAILLECLGRSEVSDRGGAFSYLKRHCTEFRKPLLPTCLQLLDRTCRAVLLLLEEGEGIRPTPTVGSAISAAAQSCA